MSRFASTGLLTNVWGLLICTCLAMVLVASHPSSNKEEFSPGEPKTGRPMAGASFSKGETPHQPHWKLGALQDNDLPNVFVVAPREFQRPLSEAAQAITDENYTEAVRLLGNVLTSPETEDYFLPPEYGGGASTSVKMYALEMVHQLPPRGREIYELRFGSEAATALEQAIPARDFSEIARVAEQYFHTRSGYQAMLLLGRHHLDRGRTLQAARCFMRVAESTNDQEEFHFEALLLAGTALQRAGRLEAAEKVVDELVEALPSQTIKVSGDAFAMRDPNQRDAYLQQLRAWLASANRSTAANAQTNWVMFGGDATRNAISSGGTPLLDPLWRVPVNDATDEELAQEIADQFNDDKLSSLSSIQPLVVGDTVLIRTPNKVFGINLQSGKRVWPYPWEDDLFGHSLQQDAVAAVGVNARKTQLMQRLWEDSIFGRMTSDGRQVYFVDGLGYATMNEFATAPGVPGQVRVKALSARSTNHLVGIQLVDEQGRSVEGKLAWRVGDVNGMDEPRLAGVFFLGPPLPLDGMLYALAEIRDEIQLIVLNADSGELEWSQQLASVEEVGSIHNSGIRRLAGAVPSFGEGVLLCPTAAGAIVAIDPATRSLLWGFQFPTRDRNMQSALAANSFRSEEKRPGEKWADGSIIISDGSAIITPVESNAIYCLDIRTGEPIWKPALPRRDGLYVAGVRNGVAVIVGQEYVHGARLTDAYQTFQVSIASIGRPTGRGVVDEQYLYLPTTNAQLIRFNLDSGKVEQVIDTERTLGNMVSVQGRIISLNYDYVTAFDQDHAARQEADSRLAIDRDDARGLALQGQLALQDNRWNEAVGSLTRSYEVAPTAARANLLVHCLLQGLEDQVPNALEVLAPYEQLLLNSPARQQYLRLRIETLVNQQQFVDGFEVLLEHSFVLAPNSTPAGQSTTDILEGPATSDLALSQERWAQTVIHRIRAAAAPAKWQRIAQRIEELGKQILADQGPELLHRYRSIFGRVVPNPSIDLRLAQHQVRQGELLKGSLKLHQLLRAERPAHQAEAMVLLARIAADTQRFSTARDYAQQVVDRFPDTELSDGSSVAAAISQLREQYPAIQQAPADSVWPEGEIEIGESGDLIGRTSFPVEFFPIKPIRDQHDGTLPITIDHDRRNDGIIRDANGRDLLHFSLRANPADISFYGSSYQTSRYIRRNELVVVVSGYDLMAIDLNRIHQTADEAVRWRRSLLPDIVHDTASRLPKQRLSKKGYTSPLGWSVEFAVDTSWQRLGAIGPLAESGFCYLKRNQLICVDPVTGELLWKRSDLPHDCELVGNEEWIAVIDPDYSTAQVFQLIDGKEVKQVELQIARNPLVIVDTQILSYEARQDHITLQLFDVFGERTTWEETFEAGTRATRVDVDRFAILEPSGRFTLRSLLDGSEIMQAKLPESYDRQSIEVVALRDTLLVCTNENASSTTLATLSGAEPIKIHIPNEIGRLVKGKMFAFDLTTHASKWKSPAIIEQFCVPDRWTLNTPFVPLLRHHPAKTERGSISPLHTELAILDIRDGRLVLHRDDIPQNTSMMHLETSPDFRSVQIELNEKRFDFTFTDRPREDAIPADTRFRSQDRSNAKKDDVPKK